MIDVLSSVQVILRSSGYSVRLEALSKAPLVCFEDETILGFCFSFDQPQDLIERWKAVESEILTRFAPQMRGAGDKAWNVYSVFLCPSPADPSQKRAINWIEEDLDRTRKIAGSGIANREDLIRLMLPVLPIQYQPALEQIDLTDRLRRRIGDISPTAAQLALDEATSPTEVVRLLGDRT
jgi:hypothetical protein